MGAPTVSFTIQTSNLGQTPTGIGNVVAVVGTSSAGTVNQPYVSPVPQNFVTNFGYGPGPQLAALVANSAGNNVVFIKAAAGTPGSQSSVVRIGVVGSSVVTTTGNSFDDYYVVVTPTVAGTIGTPGNNGPAFTVSIDAGQTTYATVNLGAASTYLIPNTGITLNFAAGTIAVGDLYYFTGTAPIWSTATLTSAITSLIGQTGYTVEDIFVTGQAAASDATSVNSNVTTLFNAAIYTNAVLHARDAVRGGTSTENEQQWMQSIQTDYASFQATNGQVAVSAGNYPCVSPIDSTQMRRPLSWFAAARDADVAISVDLGRVADGPLFPMVVPSVPVLYAGSTTPFILHNESQNAGLDGSRFMSAFTINGRIGFYIVNPNTMAALGSDLNWLQMRHVLNQMTIILYNFFTGELSSSVRVSSTTGNILPQDANSLEAQCNAQINAGLVNTGDVSAASIAITRTNNILSTHQLIVTGTIVPLGYIKTVSITIGFLNPKNVLPV